MRFRKRFIVRCIPSHTCVILDVPLRSTIKNRNLFPSLVSNFNTINTEVPFSFSPTAGGKYGD
jgi:hypothetical protein